MEDIRITVASLKSVLADPLQNLQRVRAACRHAEENGSRLLLLPELMLTGHGGHPRMTANAESVPDGPLSRSVIELSQEHGICICVGIADLCGNVVYNSQFVVDRGNYLGLQRKIYLSGDEYCHFRSGEELAVFDIGEIRFGITICYDNSFPEIALTHALHGVDLIVAPHAARTGDWPAEPPPEFCAQRIKSQQDAWEKVHRARASDHNVFVLLCNAVGPSTAGLDDVVANHAGTVMGVAPNGDVFLRTSATDFSEEMVTVELLREKRVVNHKPTQNRRFSTLMELLQANPR